MRGAVRTLLAAVAAFGATSLALATPIGPAQLDGGQFNASGLNLVDGQLGGLQIDSAGFLKVNVAAGGGAGGTASTFNSAFPGTGTAAGFLSPTGTMSGAKIDANGFLETNCAVGCAGGTFTNNADAVATSSGNGQAAAWLYAFNGATWDRLRDDASKNLQVNINAASATVGVSGTVTANQGGSWSVTDISGANLALGTVFGQSQTVVSGNNAALSLDTSGWLRVEIMSGGGTSGGGSGTSSSFGSAFPATGTAAGYITTTGSMTGANLSAAGNLDVKVNEALPTGGNTIGAVTGSGTFTVAGTVTANAGTNLNTSALALDTSVNGIIVSQGSTTSGEKGPLAQGAVTATAPSYTTAQTNPLSLDTAGGLRVTVTSTITQPVSIATASALDIGTVTATAPSYTSGTNQVISLDTAGSLRVTITSGGTSGGGGGTSSSFNSSYPATGTAAGFVSLTGTMTTGIIDANGFLKVNVAAGGGAGGTSSSFGSAFPATGTAAGVRDNSGNMSSGMLDVNGNLLVAVNKALPAGANVIGAVTASGTFPVSGTVTTSPPSNASTNEAQINGVTPLMGNGVSGTGSQRVNIASDNTPFTVNAAESGTWTVTVSTGSALSVGNVTGLSGQVSALSGANLPIQLDTAGNLRVAVMSTGEIGRVPTSWLNGSGFITTQTTGSLIPAQGAGLKIYVTGWNCANSSATPTVVTLVDGGNTVVNYTMAPAGGGSNVLFGTPIAIAANHSAGFFPQTAVTTLFCTAEGFSGQ